ncbi:hypothetical protein BDY19DRAFT_1045616, partial [Irpex rosettiformis]
MMGTDTPLEFPSTPKKAHTDNSNNAPHVSGANYSVEVSRDAVAGNLGSAIPEVDYEFFELHILPPLHSSIDINTVISGLEDDGIIVNGRWAAFPRDPWTYAAESSEFQHDKENEVFAPLTTIILEITSSKRTGVHARRALDYESSPKSAPVCCFDKEYARPDGYFVFNTPNQPAMRSNGRPYWRDLASPAEFKLRDMKEDLQDDINHICWDMHQIMREDPSCRSVFGFTIENIRMRIWMMNRSGVVVSQPFNFITIHTPPLMNWSRPNYDSGQGISNRRVCLRYHCARCQRVRRLVDGIPDATSPGRVLKDSWIDEDREREGDILQQITGQPDISDTMRKALVMLFLTLVACGNVFIEGRPDGTRSLITRGAHVPDTNIFSLNVFGHIPSHTQHTTSSEYFVPASYYQRQNMTKHFKKQHYRIVFAEE